jgi:competence protein ComEC
VGRAASAAIGAVLAALLLVPGPQPPWLWPALAAFAAIAIVGATSRTPVGSPTSWRSALAACLGALAVAIRLAVGSGAPAAVELPDGDGPWQVIVEGVAAPRDGRQPATLRLEDGSELRLAATLPRLPEIVPGDRVEVSGRLEALSDDAYGAYLGRIGVRATIFSRTIRILPRPPAMLDLEAVRREASRALAATIPEPEAGLAAGIVIGLRDRVDRDLAAAFTTAGASHVVAISGWNIAIVAASVAALGGRFGRRRRSILTVVAITAYVVFVGASPSVLRAAAMAGIVLLARESGRAGRASAALGWAAVAILIADPALVRDAGFQLSTLATAGLLAWSKPLGDRIERLIGKRLPSWLIENLAVSLAAQAATTPVVLASFGRLSLVAPVVGVVVVPLVAPAMAAAGVALAAGLAASFGPPSALATLAGLPAWVFLSIIVATVRAASALPFASIELQPPLDVVAAGLSSLLLLALAIRSTRCRMLRAVGAALGDLRIGSIRGGARRVETRPPRRASQQGWRFAALEKLAALALAGAVIGCGAVVLHRADGRTRIVVLDVGQGDAILVEGSRGSRLLVDGGPDPDRLLVAVDERLPPWDRQIDTLILTHPHEDHVAGLAILLARYRVARVYEPGMHGPGPGYAGWASELAAREIPAGRLATGDRMTLDDARFTVLWPDPGRVPAEPPDTGTGINNVSIVLLGDVAGRRFLLAGDIEEEIDPVLIGRGLPGVDVLKVAHHGSRTSSTDAFLDAVRPKIAIASAGAGNPYGHPAPGTIARLKAHGARVLRTDEDGTVEVTVEAARIGVRSSGPRRGASAPSARAASLDGIAVAAGFACGISRPAPAASRSGAAALPRTSIAAAPTTRMGPAGPDPVLLYDPSNVGPRSDGSRRTSPLGRSLARSRASLARRRRGRRLAGDAHRARQDAGRSTPRRGCRAPP